MSIADGSTAEPGGSEGRDGEALARYYAERAAQYERIYAKPERQCDLRVVAVDVASYFEGCSVLELACGTGYWTVPVASRALRVLGVDINDEVLAIARAKRYARDNAEFRRADLYAGGDLGGPFDAALAAHWWSHVPLSEVPRFLAVLHAQLLPGARVALLDNRYVAGSSTPIARRDEQGNSYQLRRLDDGSEHEVLKNFPDERALHSALAGQVTDFAYRDYAHYWLVTYRVAA